MKWKGTVSQLPNTSMAPRLARAKTTQAMSTQWTRNGHFPCSRGIDAVPLPANGCDGHSSELRAEPPDVHVHDVRSRIEVVPPHGGQQLLLGYRSPGVAHELLQEQELSLGQRYRACARVDRSANDVEREPPGRKGGGGRSSH